MFGKCNHKWLAVDMFGYQHCSKCGLAENVGFPCSHKWQIFEVGNLKVFGACQGKVYVLRCDKCGEMKNHEVTI